jgi:hypothetical protein
MRRYAKNGSSVSEPTCGLWLFCSSDIHTTQWSETKIILVELGQLLAVCFFYIVIQDFVLKAL